MIGNIYPTGRYVQISGGTASTYVNGNSGLQGVGNMRNGEAESLLDWAREKRNEELAWESLAKDNQAVKIALDNLENAKQQLKITATLARDTSDFGEMAEVQASP